MLSQWNTRRDCDHLAVDERSSVALEKSLSASSAGGVLHVYRERVECRHILYSTIQQSVYINLFLRCQTWWSLRVDWFDLDVSYFSVWVPLPFLLAAVDFSSSDGFCNARSCSSLSFLFHFVAGSKGKGWRSRGCCGCPLVMMINNKKTTVKEL